MESNSLSPKAPSRIPRKPERPYISSLKSTSMEARRRPLRTYGKRTSPSNEPSEPSSKRQRVVGPSVTTTTTTSTTITPKEKTCLLPSTDRQNNIKVLGLKTRPSPHCSPPAKKGTITAYFGRKAPLQSAVALPPSSEAEPPTEPSSERNESDTITPPSSLPLLVTASKRRARRLKTRITTQRIEEISDASDRGEEEHMNQETEYAPEGRIRRSSIAESPAVPRSPALAQTAPGVRIGEDGSSDEPLEKEDTRTRGRGKRKQPKRKTPSVQTTISLSLSEAQYTECRECDMLYNHLHPADVRHHARRHAAILRKARETRNGSGGDDNNDN